MLFSQPTTFDITSKRTPHQSGSFHHFVNEPKAMALQSLTDKWTLPVPSLVMLKSKNPGVILNFGSTYPEFQI
jgi:hypothetical protein